MALVAVAYMNHGRWVAACPRPGCMNAEMFGRCDDGTMGGLEAQRFTCRTHDHTSDGRRVTYGGCGLKCPVDWPANIADLERVLLARPVPTNRNWRPGETLEELVAQNFEHGIVPTPVLEGRPFRIVDDQVEAGALDFFDRRELGS